MNTRTGLVCFEHEGVAQDGFIGKIDGTWVAEHFASALSRAKRKNTLNLL